MFGWFKRDTEVDDAIFEYEWKKADERRKADGIVIVERADGKFMIKMEYDGRPSVSLTYISPSLRDAQRRIIDHYKRIDGCKEVRRY